MSFNSKDIKNWIIGGKEIKFITFKDGKVMELLQKLATFTWGQTADQQLTIDNTNITNSVTSANFRIRRMLLNLVRQNLNGSIGNGTISSENATYTYYSDKVQPDGSLYNPEPSWTLEGLSSINWDVVQEIKFRIRGGQYALDLSTANAQDPSTAIVGFKKEGNFFKFKVYEVTSGKGTSSIGTDWTTFQEGQMKEIATLLTNRNVKVYSKIINNRIYFALSGNSSAVNIRLIVDQPQIIHTTTIELKRSLKPSETETMNKDGLKRIGITWYQGAPDVYPPEGRRVGVAGYQGIPANGLLSHLQAKPSVGGWTGAQSTPDYVANLAHDEVAVLDIYSYRVPSQAQYLKPSATQDGGFYHYKLYLRFASDGTRQYQKVPVFLSNNGGDRVQGNLNLTDGNFAKTNWKNWPANQWGDPADWARVHEIVVTNGRGWVAGLRFAPNGGIEIGGQRDGNEQQETMTVFCAQVKIYSDPTNYSGEDLDE